MSAYAPNPSFNNNEDGYAPLTASLLARKGEATPAVDAAVHEGVDIDMAPSMPGMEPDRSAYGSSAATETVRYGPAQNDYEAPPASYTPEEVHDPSSAYADDVDDYQPTEYASNETVAETQAEAVEAETVVEPFPGAAPQRRAWTVTGPSIGGPAKPTEKASVEDVRARLKQRVKRTAETGKAGRKATITFRMPARDLIRLRLASRELGVACQAIILEALESYLEANDIAPLTDEDFAAETERLIRLKKEKARRRAG